MSYHDLNLVHSRRQRPSSIISAENLESNSDNINKQFIFRSSSSTPTTILLNLSKNNQSKLGFLHPNQAKHLTEKPKTNILVDYCTYHDVAVPRVTCL
jgi:hypothetical protein